MCVCDHQHVLSCSLRGQALVLIVGLLVFAAQFMEQLNGVCSNDMLVVVCCTTSRCGWDIIITDLYCQDLRQNKKKPSGGHQQLENVSLVHSSLLSHNAVCKLAAPTQMSQGYHLVDVLLNSCTMNG